MTKDQIVEIGLKYGRVKTIELAEKLGTSKAAVLSYVQRLRKAGVNIPKIGVTRTVEFTGAVKVLKSKLNVKGA